MRLVPELALLGLVVAVSWRLTGAVRQYALRRLLDVPNARSSHQQPTPRGGGLAIVISLVLGLVGLYGLGRLPWPLLMALMGLLPVAAIGFLDDHRPVPARWRFLVQIMAAVWSLEWIGGMGDVLVGQQFIHLGWAGQVMAVLFIVWMLNLFNFMDGIDGIAAGETIAVAVLAALLLWIRQDFVLPGEGWAGLMLAAAATGFLLWNWPPARIFMGDVASGVLGFVLAVLAVWSATQHSLSLVAWLILAGVFLVDATLTLLVRLFRRERWYEAHRSHAYQHAARRWGGHRLVTLSVLAVNGLWLLPNAWLAMAYPRWEVGLLVVALLPLMLAGYRLGAGRP